MQKILQKILTCWLLLYGINGLAQIKLASYEFKKVDRGFTFGINRSGFTMQLVNNYQSDSIYAIVNTPKMGLEFGLIFSYRFYKSHKLSMTPMLSFAMSELNYYTKTDSTVKNNLLITDFVYIQNIISVKIYSKRVNNSKTYLLLACIPKYGYKADAKYYENKWKGTIYPYTMLFKKFDLSYEIGAGYTWLGVNNKLSVEISFSTGLRNILIKDANEFTKMINSLNTKSLTMRFYLE